MASKAEAKDFIEQRRRARHFSNDVAGSEDANARSLHRALDMLSAQLYAKPTHFILEMIQNADDNEYSAGVQPTLTLVYRDDGYLWVGCNEVGFSKANVAAICEIADSTKKVTDSKKGYIGEKGIGFKSVFKVADKVWISSGNFAFRFDRDELLGMIVPIWCDFPACENVNDQTMFCLQLPKAEHRAHVRGHMLGLSAELLLFLRKLRAVHVVIVRNAGREQAGSKHIEHDFWLRREDVANADAYVKTTLTRQDRVPSKKEQVEELVVFRHTTKSMPKEEKREGITETELVLGFPISSTSPVGDSRWTYNFLPVRQYGFRFLLQADFILTANRNDIVEGNDWNAALKESALCLFLQSVKIFNSCGVLKYEWPRFTTSASNIAGTFMDDFLRKLYQRLRAEPVLESWSGGLASPAALITLPKRYRDVSDQPLLSKSEHLPCYLANNKYKPGDIAKLGVQEQLPTAFFKMLQETDDNYIQSKDAAWHSELARALINSNIARHKLASVKLVLRQDGKWQAADQGEVFLPEDRTDVPAGIKMDVVDNDAAKDEFRRQLFRSMGIRKLDNARVEEAILERHKTLSADQQELSLDCLINQVRFFYDKHRQVKSRDALKVVTQDSEKLVIGSNLYMPECAAAFSFREHFPKAGPSCEFLHQKYITRFSTPGDDGSTWSTWLEQKLGISPVPRLSTEKGKLHPDMDYLIRNCCSIVWLKLLRDNWDRYFRSVEKVTPSTLGLGAVLVECTDGVQRPLKNVYLAHNKICDDARALQHIHFIKVDDPDNGSWLQLSRLGLGTRKDIHFYLMMLRNLASLPEAERRAEDVARVLEVLANFKDYEDQDLVKAVLRKESLTPISSGTSTTWHRLKNCRWKAPSCMRSVVTLYSSYAHLRQFFVHAMGVQDATFEDVIAELRHESRSSRNVQHTKDLLFELDKLLKCKPANQAIPGLEELVKHDIFPIRRASQEISLVSGKDKSWFIADRDRLYKCFATALHLLDFQPDELLRLREILSRTGIEDRSLSKVCQEETIPDGHPTRILDVSDKLHAKAEIISYLAPELERPILRAKLSSLEVLRASGLILRRFVKVDGEKIYGRDEAGRAVLTTASEPLHLFLPADGLSWHFIADELFRLIEHPLPNSEGVMLSILITSDSQEIKDILERKGLWNEEYDFESPPPPAQDHETPAGNDGTTTHDDQEPQQEPEVEVKASLSQSPPRPTDFQRGSQEQADTPRPHPDTMPSNGATGTGEGSSAQSSSNHAAVTRQEPQQPQPIHRMVSAAEGYDMNAVQVLSTSDEAEVLRFTEILHCAEGHVGDTNPGTQSDAERFVFTVLQQHFEAPDACWTSFHRTCVGLAPLYGGQSQSSFELKDSTPSQRFATWLMERRFDKAADWVGGEVTFHIDVKATPGGSKVPFVMTAKELARAKQWHANEKDVYIILRVYNMQATPKLCVFVNPLDMGTSGKLRFEAIGGFAVRMK